MSVVKAGILATVITAPAVIYADANIDQVLKAYKPAMHSAPVLRSATYEEINETVEVEVLVDEDFSKWTSGSLEEPSTTPVPQSGEEAQALMNYPGNWTLFQMYEAGGAGYQGYDELGKDGTGYLMLSGVDVFQGTETGYYRLTCRAMNVNENAQTQKLQTMISDDEWGFLIGGNADDVGYHEWTTVSWIGQVISAKSSFMIFGWNGKMMLDEFKIEKLTYPLSTPEVTFGINEEGNVNVPWTKVPEATSYTVEIGLLGQDQEMTTIEVGDVESCTFELENLNPSNMYVVYVTARDGRKISYPGTTSGYLKPGKVGTAVVLPATDVTADGFTANWEAAPYATRYFLFPTVTHTAEVANEEFFYLDNFLVNVPETATGANTIPVNGSLNYYFSYPGWSVPYASLAWIDDTPTISLIEAPMFGLKGALTSPKLDFSAGNGTIKITGTVYSNTDDMVMKAALVDENGEIYSYEIFEITTTQSDFEVTLYDGKPESKLVISVEETAEGGDKATFSSLNVYTLLNEGETVTAPIPTVFVNSKATSAHVECTLDDNNKYSYSVQGYFYPGNIMGEVSESIEVVYLTNVEKQFASMDTISLSNGVLEICNPDNKPCSVYTLSGVCIFNTCESTANIALEESIYLVKIGTKTYKIVNK